MSDEQQSIPGLPIEEERYDLTFRNGALQKLKDLASFLSIPQDQLGDVVTKGIKIIDAVKDANEDQVIIEKKDGNKEVINIKEI